jgi:hypothetical protein
MAKKPASRSDYASILRAQKSVSTLSVLFVPSRDREDQPIDQELWVTKSLEILGTLFGGATAYPKGRGVWRDDEQGGKLLFDEPVVIQSYTTEQVIERQAVPSRDFLVRLGTECRQGAVGFLIDRDYLEIRFPFHEGGGR